MRGQSLYSAAQRHDVVKRHSVKFGCYPALKRHVRMLSLGENIESQWLGLRREEANALTEFYGVTRWPGKRQKLGTRRGDKATRYIPRPNWYRAGSPLVLDTRWRLRNVEGMHSAQELVNMANKTMNSAFTSGQVAEISGATPVHMLMLNPDMMQEWKNEKGA